MGLPFFEKEFSTRFLHSEMVLYCDLEIGFPVFEMALVPLGMRKPIKNVEKGSIFRG